MAYAAEWDLDDRLLDREEVEAVVAHVAAVAHLVTEVARGKSGLVCTFRFPVSAAADIVSALDPGGELLGDEWWRDLDPPLDGDDGYFVRVELIGPVDGALVDDELVGDPGDDADVDDTYDDGDDDDEVDHDGDGDDDEEDAGRCVARLRLESADNREAWPVAFAIASAVVERLGGDLRDEVDEELYELQRKVPAVAVRTPDGIEVVGALESAEPEPAGDEELLN